MQIKHIITLMIMDLGPVLLKVGPNVDQAWTLFVSSAEITLCKFTWNSDRFRF